MTYWILAIKNVDRGTYVPTYEILTSKPAEGKMAALEPGECLDLFKCSLSEDGTYVTCDLFRVSNIDSVVAEEQTESFFIERP